METSDFLQADDIFKVIKVPFAVKAEHKTDDEIERFICLNSSGRQGRYYRLAAEKFGLVENLHNSLSLTDMGRYFISLQDDRLRINFMAQTMRKMEVFSQAIQYLENSNPRPNLSNLKDWFIFNYQGSSSTAERRFRTFQKYLQVTGFI